MSQAMCGATSVAENDVTLASLAALPTIVLGQIPTLVPQSTESYNQKPVARATMRAG